MSSISAIVLAAAVTIGCQSSTQQSSTGGSAVLASSSSTQAAKTPSATGASLKHPLAPEFAKPGFLTLLEDGRLWIFKDGSKEFAEFQKNGELAKHVVYPGQGPGRMTLKAPDRDTVLAYLCSKPGYTAITENGRTWIFRDGSKEFAEFQKHGELAKHIVRPAAGPMRSTLRAPDAETLDSWMYSKPGFVTLLEDGRLWIFKDGSKELADFRKHGELAKHVVRPGAGPNRMTVKAPDASVIDEYMLWQPGFITFMEDGRLWVFRQGAKEYADFQEHGELAKHVVRPAAGPNRVTIKAPDIETVNAYLAVALAN